MEVLAEGPNFNIKVADRVVWCRVIDAQNISPQEGAQGAARMLEVLSESVLHPSSLHRALVFDVRKGPPVFGPKTRAALEQMFAQAEACARPTCIIVGGSAVQRLQFRSLSEGSAPSCSAVFDDEVAARRWVRAQLAG